MGNRENEKGKLHKKTKDKQTWKLILQLHFATSRKIKEKGKKTKGNYTKGKWEQKITKKRIP